MISIFYICVFQSTVALRVMSRFISIPAPQPEELGETSFDKHWIIYICFVDGFFLQAPCQENILTVSRCFDNLWDLVSTKGRRDHPVTTRGQPVTNP